MLVSAIMPTARRPEMAAAAVECFLDQTWPDKELIILDDLDAPSFPDGITGPGIHYFSQPGGTIGAKRNKCCELAAGEIIMHFDDDDYSCPDRITDQVNRILETGTPITGYSSMEFRGSDGSRWFYAGYAPHAIGTSLASESGTGSELNSSRFSACQMVGFYTRTSRLSRTRSAALYRFPQVA